ncbi:MlaD family protein [Geodermatophilus aquaeductus]|uniref:Phospholipid/cholesterol/gamma-HCH transport system substrate-binding protein n=1 Tax=Geodermatophilus aquaeductus TaxID=1564161 RepID=A0A521AN70_9ACTN|nr:MlaD family protein [Geodermatophilus aquaeductus]SMO36245.1 phospholipid/cholesterol/gamma-HCH transport system substrate-binding protein [Geodermatophilus aquaeductus]
MITRKIKLQLLAFATVALVGISYVGFTYVGLDRLLLGSGFDVAADFADSGGIFVNAEVTYRGVAVGRVSDMQLTDDGVRVTMTIEPDAAPIPADTDAVVANRSAVGEQYVDLRPASADGPFLADGAVIPQSRTAIPIPVEQLLLDVDGLVTSLDAEDLRVVVDELGRAFAGAGDDLARLIDNGDLLLARAEQSLPETLQLITDGQTVLRTQAESRSAIEQWASDLRAVSDTLVDIDPDLRGLVVNAPDAGAALQDLVDNAGPGLGSLVRNLDVLNGVTIPRLDGVEQMLVTYPDVVSGGFSVVRNDGGTLRAHFGFVLNADDPRACTSGYVSTGQTRSPGAVGSVDVDSVGCDVVAGADPTPGDGVDETGSNIRGAQNIGGDGGVGSPGPQGQAGALPPVATVVDDVLGGLLGALPFARTTG